MTKIGFVGAGQMAQALGGGIAASDTSVQFVVSDPSQEAVESFQNRTGEVSVSIAASNWEVFSECDFVFLAVKPQYFESAVKTEDVARAIDSREEPPVVVSIMAGVEIGKIQEQTGIGKVIRVMPNTPCLVGAGACGLAASSEVSEKQVELVTSFLSTTGIVLPVAENLLPLD